MSATRMMILGLVRWMQPVHGYDVRRELLNWNADQWANVAPGSIYHALRKLTEEGLLEEVGTEQVGARPARTSYRITSRGENEFNELLRKSWWEYHQPIDPFLAGFAFLSAVARPEASAALRSRARMLRAAVAGFQASLESGWLQRGKPSYVGWTFELTVARLEVEADWCDTVAGRIDSGTPYFPPGQDLGPYSHPELRSPPPAGAVAEGGAGAVAEGGDGAVAEGGGVAGAAVGVNDPAGAEKPAGGRANGGRAGRPVSRGKSARSRAGGSVE